MVAGRDTEARMAIDDARVLRGDGDIGEKTTDESRPDGGTMHRRKDLEPFRHVLARQGWDTPVREVAALALDHVSIHGAEPT